MTVIPRLIAIRGKAGAGKDTVADYLVEKYGYQKMSFAHPLKRIVAILTGWRYDFVNGATPEYRRLRETLIHPVYKMTCRQLLQFVGTELFRDQLHPEVWVQCLRQDIEALFNEDPEALVIVTDCRFPNEAEMLLKLGGRMLHIQRPMAASCLLGETSQHSSEKDFNTSNEQIIHNNGTLDQLYETVRTTLAKVSKKPIGLPIV